MLTIEAVSLVYPANDPIHGVDHVLRVLKLAELIGPAEGADMEILRAAVLLHDAEPPVRQARTENARRDHHHNSAEYAAGLLEKEGWSQDRIEAVAHCIRAHRFRDNREPPNTIEARVLFDADKLDAIGAIGIARAIAYAVKAGQPPYAPVSRKFIETGELEPDEPHSAYHEYICKLSKLRNRMQTDTGRKLADARHKVMVEFFQTLEDEAQVSDVFLD